MTPEVTLQEGGTTISSTLTRRKQKITKDALGRTVKMVTYEWDGATAYQTVVTTYNVLDRLHEFDHVGRVVKMRTGAEARSSSTTSLDRPYREDVTYDAFNNISNRAGKYWWIGLRDGTTTFTYANNRNGAWDYDADGRLLDSNRVQTEYDAAGRTSETTSNRSNVNFYYDGDGRRVKTVNSMTDTATPPNTTSVTTYYINSSLLSETITELNQTGAKTQGYVLNGSGVLAQEKTSTGSDAVLWRLTDESGYHVRLTNMDGDVEPDYSAELDPFGTNARISAPGPLQDPSIPGERENGALNTLGFGDPIASGMGECRLNGAEVSCQRALGAMSNGSGTVDAGTSVTLGAIIDLPAVGSFFFMVDVSTASWQFPSEGNLEGAARTFSVVNVGGGERNHATGPTNQGGGEPLSDCVKEILRGDFPDLDLNNIRIHRDGLPEVVESFNTVEGGAGAFTRGNDIYFAEGEYDPHSGEGIGDIAHELRHSDQYRILGEIEFARQYAVGYLSNIMNQLGKSDLNFSWSHMLLMRDFIFDTLGMKSSQALETLKKMDPENPLSPLGLDLTKAYEEIPLEVPAYADERNVENRLGRDLRVCP